MRSCLALVAVFVAAGCAQPAPAALRPNTLERLSKEVSSLPGSPQKTRIEQLLGELEAQPAPVAAREPDISKMSSFAAAAAAVRLDLGFATDAKDWSKDGTDDGIELHVIPRDDAGSAIKCPGSIEAVLVDEGEGLFKRSDKVDEWVVSPDTLRRSWNESLFPAYIVQLPWHGETPASGRYKLNVTFAPLYGAPLSAAGTVDITAAEAQPRPE